MTIKNKSNKLRSNKLRSNKSRSNKSRSKKKKFKLFPAPSTPVNSNIRDPPLTLNGLKKKDKESKKKKSKKKKESKKIKNPCKSTKKCFCYPRNTSKRRRGYKSEYEYKNRSKIPPNLINDKEVAMKAVKINKSYFYSISKKLKDDKDVVMETINKSRYSNYFNEVSDRLKDDKEVVMKALKNNKRWFPLISNRLKQDVDVLKISDFSKTNIELKHKIDNKRYFLNLFKIARYKKKNENKFYEYFSHSLLLNASKRLRDDKDLVIKAIQITSDSFIHASDRLKKDPDVMKLIFDKIYTSIQLNKYFPKYDKDFALFFMKHKAYKFSILKPQFINDKDVVLMAMKDLINIRRNILPYISEKMKNDEDIKKILESKHLEYFADKYNNDKPFILKSLKKHNTFSYISKKLKDDKDVVLTILNRQAKYFDPDAILKQTKLKNDRDVFLKSLDNKIKHKKLFDKKKKI